MPGSGRSAYYVEMIANAGLVAIHTAASSRLVAPLGGVRAALGTNPIAIAVPSSRGPIVLDIGTSEPVVSSPLIGFDLDRNRGGYPRLQCGWSEPTSTASVRARSAFFRVRSAHNPPVADWSGKPFA